MIYNNGNDIPNRLKRFVSIFGKIAITGLLIIQIFFVAVFFIIIPAVEEAHLSQNKKLAKNMVQLAISELDRLNKRASTGALSIRTAKKKAIEHLKELKYGVSKENYYFIIDKNSKFLMHPEVKEISDFTLDSLEGSSLKVKFENFTKGKNQEAFIKYTVTPSGNKGTSEKKITYLEKFIPWGWAVGTGFLPASISDEIDYIKSKIKITGLFLALLAILVTLPISIRMSITKRKKKEIESKLRFSELKFKTMFETSPYAIAVLEFDSFRIIDINQAFTSITGYSIEDVFRKKPSEIPLDRGSDEMRNDYIEKIRSQKEYKSDSYKIITKAGAERTMVSTSIVFSMGNAEYIMSTMIDVTDSLVLSEEKKKLEEMIASRTSDLAKLDSELSNTRKEVKEMKRKLIRSTRAFEFTTESFMITDSDGTIISVNPAFTRITGYSEIEAIGENPRILKSNRHDPEFYETMWKELLENNFWSGQIWNRRKSGEAYPAQLTITAITDDNGKIENYIAISQDQSELHQSIDELEQSRMFDKLTGLPNRSLLIDRLSVSCERASEKGGSLAVIMIGLDRFTNINTAMGYLFGDKLLHAAAMRLQELTGNSLTLTRFEGDEFIIIFPFEKNMSKALEFIKMLNQSFQKPFSVDNETIHIDASIGISIFPQDGKSPDELLKNASLALDISKRSKDRTFRLFTEDLNSSVKKTIVIENRLRDEMTFKELFLNYQPKVRPLTGEIVGMEALLRWRNSRGELISPADFIPIAEDIGVISKVGKIALFDACSFNKDLSEMGHNQVVAVNISPKQFNDSNFTKDLLSALEISMLAPKMLELEITESAIVSDITKAKRIMAEIKKEGISFSLDDFGTGYSSPSHLMNLPFSAVKIDKSFIDDITENPKTIAVLSSLALMARNLGIKFIVEGVETEEQLSLVMDLEENVIIQGYIYSKPLSDHDFMELLKEPTPFSF